VALSEDKKRAIRMLADASSEALVALAEKAPIEEADIPVRKLTTD
jgi:hypothetical protein